jgi:Zn finger protein HypA/HybF involved in hydrogenase expression
MNFVQHDLGSVVVEADILREKVECDQCDIPAELLAAFFYCPQGVDAPLGDEELMPVIAILCPLCGRQFQLSDLDCHSGG